MIEAMQRQLVITIAIFGAYLLLLEYTPILVWLDWIFARLPT